MSFLLVPLTSFLRESVCLWNGWAEATCAEQGASADRKQAICTLSYKGILPGGCKEKRKNSLSVCGVLFLMYAVFSLEKKNKKLYSGPTRTFHSLMLLNFTALFQVTPQEKHSGVCACWGMERTVAPPKYFFQKWFLFSSCLKVIWRLDRSSFYG